MKILIIMDPGIIIPVKGYGGHERLVEMFAKEYLRLGHEVHLLITGGSTVEGCVVHNFGKEGFPPKKTNARKAIPIAWKFLWNHRNDFDLYHNFGRLVYLLPVLKHPIKKIMTYGREISNRNVKIFHKMRGMNIVFTACSADLLSRVNTPGHWEVVHNAIEFSKYTLVEKVEEKAPLIFLGRLEKVKGCHTAIKVAKETGDRLIIAGNISSLPEEMEYYKKEIEPYVDGKQICYVGQLNDNQKNKYLGNAKALLFPIEWNEPFGIVMIESMACGTPVIAFKRGSVDEVVEEGLTGFKVDRYEDMIKAVQKVSKIDRQICRDIASQRFDVSIIAVQYLSLVDNYRKTIVIVTTGQPAANPRVVKEYEALRRKGYVVKVLYTYSAEWSYKIDTNKFFIDSVKKQDFYLVGGNPFEDKYQYFVSRVMFKVWKLLVKMLPITFLKQMTFARPSFYLWKTAIKFPANLYIAHYLGALPSAMKAAKRYKSKVIFDAEDFHRGEEPYHASQIKDVIELEDRLLPNVNAITTASPLIRSAYSSLYKGIPVITINNVFSKRHLQLPQPVNNPIRLFWFSQNIGPKRGLENVIEGINMLDFEISLVLMGNQRDIFFIKKLMNQINRKESLQILDTIPPEHIFLKAASFDIGLAAEEPHFENRNICLTNKIFTYLLAGNCILASDTNAQREFLANYPDVGFLYRHDDPSDLAKQITLLHENRNILANCKRYASNLAKIELNWENEREKLYSLVEGLI